MVFPVLDYLNRFIFYPNIYTESRVHTVYYDKNNKLPSGHDPQHASNGIGGGFDRY